MPWHNKSANALSLTKSFLININNFMYVELHINSSFQKKLLHAVHKETVYPSKRTSMGVTIQTRCIE